MSPVILAQAYKQAVSKQSRAQVEFETSELAHRAKNKAALIESTREVAAAAARLQEALEPPGAVVTARAPPARRSPPAPVARATTPAEEELLRQLLTGALLPRQKRAADRPFATEERPRPARAPDGSFVSRSSLASASTAESEQEADQAGEIEA